MPQSVNTFSELNSDSHPVSTQSNIMTDAINATLTTKGKNQLILQNMEGNEKVANLTKGFIPLGVGVYNDIAYIVSGRFDTNGDFIEGEIGTFPSPNWGVLNSQFPVDPEFYVPLVDEYQPLHNFSNSTNPTILNQDSSYVEPFRTDKFNFLSDRLIEVELQPSYDDSVNIILTEDNEPVRLINSRFKADPDTKKAALAERRQTKDTNTYSAERWESTRLFRQANKIPDLEFNGVDTGGEMYGGNYRFYFKLTDSDGALTDVVEESGIVSISYDDYGADFIDITDKLVTFTIGNLDRNFSGVKVYYSHYAGETEGNSTIYEILNIYDITDDEISITIFGTEATQLISRELLNLDYSSISRVKTMTQTNDRLLLGNITNSVQDFEALREAAVKIKLEESWKPLKIVGKEEGYKNPDNVYNFVGYWAGETYEIGIVGILKEGRGLTPALPIRGGDNYEGNFSYTNLSIAGNNGFLGNSSSVLHTENRLGLYRTDKCRPNMLYYDTDSPTYNTVPVLTDIKYFTVDMNDFLNDPIIQDTLDGFFFVRKERKRDCIIQGYFCNSRSHQISSSSTDRANYPGVGRYYEDPGTGDFGTDGPTVDFNNTNIYVDPQYHTTDKVHANRGTFYAPDMLCDPELFASIFDGSGKGLIMNPDPIVAWHDFNLTLGSDITVGGTSYQTIDGYPTNITDYNNGHTLLNTTPLPNNDEFIALPAGNDMVVQNLYANWTEDPVTPTLINGDYDLDFSVYTAGGMWSGGNPLASTNSTDLNIQLNILDPTNVTGTAIIDSDDESNPAGGGSGFGQIQLTGASGLTVQHGDVNNPTTVYTWANGQPFAFSINLAGVGLQYTDNSGTVQNITFGVDDWIVITIDVVNFQTTTSFVDLSQLNSGNILGRWGALNLRPFGYCPTPLEEESTLFPNISPTPKRTINMQYVGGAIDPVVSNQWANIVRKAEYKKYADYVGVDISVFDWRIWDGLAGSTPTGNYQGWGTQPGNETATRLSDFYYRNQIDGFNFALQCNVYNSSNGPLSREKWKVKYGNNVTFENYFAISKRYRLDNMPSNNIIELFGGDCYIGYDYKRHDYGLGISGVPTATDPDLYNGVLEEGKGLLPRGFVFPLVTENNNNAALRSFDDYDAVETALYGKKRTFWPHYDSVQQMRSSRQPESTGYNFGYSKSESDKVRIGLNDRSPSLNINYKNRIMVSSPAIAGNFYNGYTDFSGLNFRDYNKQLGEITKLISHNDYCYAIFETGIGVVPINQRTMVTEQTGGVFLDDSQVLAQKMQIISTEYGSDQQFSVIKTDQFVYGVDLSKNKVWRITSGGGQHKLDLISDFAVQAILNDYKTRIEENNMRMVVKANYDRQRNNVIFSYLNEEHGRYNTDFYTSVEVVDDPNDPDNPIVNTGITDDPVSGIQQTGKDEVFVSKEKESTYVVNSDGKRVEANRKDDYGNFVYELWKENQLGSLYWNETLGKWVSRLSWNPLWTMNLSSDLYSFSATRRTGDLWKHFSENVPYCHFYGDQHKFVFEFVLVDNSSAQKVLDNLHMICNRAFPGRIIYGLLENDVDYETYQGIDNGYIELLKQRHEADESINAPYLFTNSTVMPNGNYNDWTQQWQVIGNNVSFTMVATNGDYISQEESERIVGGFFVWNGTYYIIGNSFENNGLFYNELLDQNGINITGAVPNGITFDEIQFGIIKQNMEYIEDHLYIEVGKDDDKSRIRDKAIRVRLMYEGYDYVTIQAIISKFVYSFN